MIEVVVEIIGTIIQALPIFSGSKLK